MAYDIIAMSITAEIGPALEPGLHLPASEVGLSLDAYLLRLAERDVQKPSQDPRVVTSVRLAESLRGKLGACLKNG
jgi:hypothetical protein